jgi:hypothetical protein
MKLPSPTELARRFDEILRDHVGDEKYGQILRLNRTPEYRNSCASHDYCDANMTMLEAMKSFGIPEDMVVEDDQCHRLWNLAWEKWKSNG